MMWLYAQKKRCNANFLKNRPIKYMKDKSFQITTLLSVTDYITIATVTLFTRYNRLNVCLHESTSCPTGGIV